MQLRHIARRSVEPVTPDTTLRRAALKLIQQGVTALPVCRNGRLVGTLTAHDLIVRATSERRDPNRTPVADLMSQPATYCFEDQDLREALRRMREGHLTRIWVVARDGRLAGVVRLRDVLLQVARSETDERAEAGTEEKSVDQSTQRRTKHVRQN